MRALGIPIDTESFAVGFGTEAVEGYRLRPGALYLPMIRIVEAAGHGGTGGAEPAFTREDLEIVLEALREAAEIPGSPLAEEARSAYRKLAFDLDELPESAPVVRASTPGASEVGAVLHDLNDALLRRKRVKFRYHGLARGEPTHRDVAPYGLLLERGTWYLVGNDALRDGVRMFHAGRIEDVRVNSSAPATADYDIPADFRLADFRGRDAWELGDESEEALAHVRFDGPLGKWADRNGHGQLVSEESDGSAVRAFRVRQDRAFLGWILGLQGRARIVEPTGLAEELRRLALDIETAHG